MGGRCRLTMFTKQVSRPVDSLDPPSWPPRLSRSSELEEFLCPTRCQSLPPPTPPPQPGIEGADDAVGGFPADGAPPRARVGGVEPIECSELLLQVVGGDHAPQDRAWGQNL
jgi:hypothetical protein